jgi:uncharacterized membrane protein
VLAVAPPTREARSPRLLRALLPTIATIAAYTIVDGVGVRKSHSPMGYALLLSAVQGTAYVGLLLARSRNAFVAFARAHLVRGLFAGAASAAAYTSILWCMTQAPMGLVAALRESSVLVASFLGGFFLRERLSPRLWLGALLVFVGALFMDA